MSENTADKAAGNASDKVGDKVARVIEGPVALATANSGKASEIKAILPTWQLLPRPDSVPDVDEYETSLLGNARLKARAICDATGLPVLADDTGLEIDALNGEPGVHSARYAGPNATDEQNIEKALVGLRGVAAEQRTARFRTVALLLLPNGREVVGVGVMEGRIAERQVGGNGFGYDSIFVPTLDGDGPEASRTYAEMSEDEKNAISHRYRAFIALRDLVAEMEI